MLGALAAACLAGCGLAAPGQVLPVTPPATPGVGTALPAHSILSVDGTRLLRNGEPFIPHGVSLTGFVARQTALSPTNAGARDAFGPDELRSARGYGADTIRLVVGQSALAARAGSGSVDYRRSLLDAVSNARAMGFVVVLALDVSAPGDAGGPPPTMPDLATLGTWGILAPLFAGDQGVAFELFNAPGAAPIAAGWAAWANGGSVPGQESVAGMQDIVSSIRGSNATNVIIVDGLDHGHSLDGAPLLSDPRQATVYGIEPYQRAGDGPSSWAADFGIVAQSRPVLATEWDAASAPQPGGRVPQVCSDATPALAVALLGYLASIHVGVIGYAFDQTGTLVRDLNFALTSYDRFSCGVSGDGPGEVLARMFAAPVP